MLKVPELGANKAIIANSATQLNTKYRMLQELYQGELTKAKAEDPTKTQLSVAEINEVFRLFNSVTTGYDIDAIE